MKKAAVLSIFLAPILATALIATHVAFIFYTPYEGPEVVFAIKPGEGFSRVNYKLSKQEIIPNARIFHYYAKYTDKMTSLKAGSYKIPSGVHMGEVLAILTSGTPMLTKVTIPEGKNLYEIAEILERKRITESIKFIAEAKNSAHIKSFDQKAPSLEGYLFPETYMFAPKTSAKQVINTMLETFKNKTKDINWDHPFLNKHQIIILASIVEKETGAKWERPTIAGVYLNRLKKKMRLQADPTTIYGIWENYDGNLRKKHLLQKTPYNTYKINGLPLGPIANPSLAAIKAVLNPQEHKYLYFVSKNDGTHIFTSTYKEHLAAVKEWQLKRKNRKGKSWRDLKQN